MASTDNTSSSELLERNGPKYGISFDRAQADTLFRQHVNQTIKTFEYIDTGYNNLIFFIDVNETSERYVLKIGGRYWISIKTEAEVNALMLLAKYTTIPTPKVIAYSSDRSNEFGVEWILMTRLPGENMKAIRETHDLSSNAIKSIARDLADYVSQMHFAIPRFEKIGALTVNGHVCATLDKLGPWTTYEGFIRDRIEEQRATLLKNAVFKGIEKDNADAIDQFKKMPFPSLGNLPFVFSHGDLDTQNILISLDDPEAPRITGIVDWEWAGSFPCSEEYFTSYDYFLQSDNTDIRSYFLDELEKRHVLTPRTIERFSLLEKFNRFVTNLAPWDLTDLVHPDDPTVKTRLDECRSTIQSAIGEIRNELGCDARNVL